MDDERNVDKRGFIVSNAYDKIRIEKNHDKGMTNGLKYAVSAMQGWRYEMEDAHCARINPYNLKDWSFFAVFDGHGGNFCSNKCSEILWEEIFHQLLKKAGVDSKGSLTLDINKEKLAKLNEEKIIEAIKESFFAIDKKLYEYDIFKNEEDRSGTTVVGCLLTPTQLFLINCGDSRGILVKGNHIELNTYDHKPTQLKEKQRIQNAGGIVALNRVNGGLATSRGLGDFEYKNVRNISDSSKWAPHRQFVSSEPDVFHTQRDVTDKFVILACDGIWDVCKNEDVKDFYLSKLAQAQNKINPDDLIKINDELLNLCLEKGSRDNMSVIIIYFTDKPSVIKKQESLNNLEKIFSGKNRNQ